MSKENEMAMVIESLADRVDTITSTEVCTKERKEYHMNMMKLEAKYLLELLGVDDDENDIESFRQNLKKVATQTAGLVFHTLSEERGLVKALQSIQSPNKRKR